MNFKTMLKTILLRPFLSTLCRKAALKTAGRRWSLMKRPALEAGLTAGLCVLCESNALASFGATNGPYWPGETDYYYGNTWISNSVTLNNSGSMFYNTASMPGDTGPIEPGVYRAGNFYWGMVALDLVAD